MPTARFPIRWRGYDRGAVDQFLARFADDYDRLQAGLATVEELKASSREPDPAGELSAARAEADQIRRSAEEDRARIISEAEQRAAAIVAERVETARAEYERLHAMRNQAAATMRSAVDLLRDLDDTLPAASAYTPPDTAPSAVARAESATTRLRGAARSPWVAGVALLVLAAGTLSAVSYARYASGDIAGPAAADATAMPSGDRAVGEQPGLPQASAPVTPASDSATDAAQENVPAMTGDASAPSQEAAGTSRLTIVLRAERDCWIRVTLDGAAPAEHMLKAGAELTFRSERDAVFRVGDAGAVSLTVNGRPEPPLGRPGEVVTKRIAAPAADARREDDGTIAGR
jgi:DivIVA domain-containing protein